MIWSITKVFKKYVFGKPNFNSICIFCMECSLLGGGGILGLIPPPPPPPPPPRGMPRGGPIMGGG